VAKANGNSVERRATGEHCSPACWKDKRRIAGVMGKKTWRKEQ